MTPTTKAIELRDELGLIKPGDVMKTNPTGSHIRRLRDDYLGRMNAPRSERKAWHDAALAERFIVVATYDNGFCKAISYTIVGSGAEGCCIASNLVRA